MLALFVAENVSLTRALMMIRGLLEQNTLQGKSLGKVHYDAKMRELEEYAKFRGVSKNMARRCPQPAWPCTRE